MSKKKKKLPSLWKGPSVRVAGVPTSHPDKNVARHYSFPVARDPRSLHDTRTLALASASTNWPSQKSIQRALSVGQGQPKKRGTKPRQRTASQLLHTARRDAEAWLQRIQSPLYSPKPSPFGTRPPPGPPSGGGAGTHGGGSHRKPFTGYRIPPLTKTEYEALIWLASQGWDGKILWATETHKELPDGTVVLGPISEQRAQEVKYTVERFPNAFLNACKSQSLAEKLNTFVDSIV